MIGSNIRDGDNPFHTIISKHLTMPDSSISPKREVRKIKFVKKSPKDSSNDDARSKASKTSKSSAKPSSKSKTKKTSGYSSDGADKKIRSKPTLSKQLSTANRGLLLDSPVKKKKKKEVTASTLEMLMGSPSSTSSTNKSSSSSSDKKKKNISSNKKNISSSNKKSSSTGKRKKKAIGNGSGSKNLSNWKKIDSKKSSSSSTKKKKIISGKKKKSGKSAKPRISAENRGMDLAGMEKAPATPPTPSKEFALEDRLSQLRKMLLEPVAPPEKQKETTSGPVKQRASMTVSHKGPAQRISMANRGLDLALPFDLGADSDENDDSSYETVGAGDRAGFDDLYESLTAVQEEDSGDETGDDDELPPWLKPNPTPAKKDTPKSIPKEEPKTVIVEDVKKNQGKPSSSCSRDECVALKRQLESMTAKSHALQQKIDKKKDEAVSIKQDYKQQIDSLNTKKKAFQEELDQAAQKCERLVQELEAQKTTTFRLSQRSTEWEEKQQEFAYIMEEKNALIKSLEERLTGNPTSDEDTRLELLSIQVRVEEQAQEIIEQAKEIKLLKEEKMVNLRQEHQEQQEQKEQITTNIETGELGAAELKVLLEGKDEEKRDLEKELEQTVKEHLEALKNKDETIAFFQKELTKIKLADSSSQSNPQPEQAEDVGGWFGFGGKNK